MYPEVISTLTRPTFCTRASERVFGSFLSKEIAATRDFLGEFVRRLLSESPVRTTLIVFRSPSLHDPLRFCHGLRAPPGLRHFRIPRCVMMIFLHSCPAQVLSGGHYESQT